MRRRNNNQGGQKHRHGGQRRYNNNNQGGGNRDQQNLGRQKHHATQMREKFMNHARDAQINGDRVDVEYYLQHVDHYNRVLADIALIEAERQEKFREQQAQHQPEGESSSDDAEPQDAADAGNDEASEPINPGNQPRMTRGPRRQHQPRPADDHNGAQAANANSDDIPLPGGVIGAV